MVAVPIVNKEQEDIVQSNVVVNARVSIKELLSIAGLSGTGLSKLCDRKPPLDRQQVQAVILYAEANNLGPGYIYSHLEQNGCVVDEEFLQFAALDDETLALFRKAIRELRTNGSFAAEIRTPIPEFLFDLFARFVEVFTGIEASTVTAVLRRRQQPQENTHTGESVFGEPGPTDEPTGVVTLSEADTLDRFWRQALGQLQLQMTRGTFDTWLKDTRLIARNDMHFTVGVKNSFAKDWLENRLFITIRRTLTNLSKDTDDREGPDVEIDFVVVG